MMSLLEVLSRSRFFSALDASAFFRSSEGPLVTHLVNDILKRKENTSYVYLDEAGTTYKLTNSQTYSWFTSNAIHVNE